MMETFGKLDDIEASLLNIPPNSAQRGIALAVVLALPVGFGLTALFAAAAQLPHITAFIPTVVAMIFLASVLQGAGRKRFAQPLLANLLVEASRLNIPPNSAQRGIALAVAAGAEVAGPSPRPAPHRRQDRIAPKYNIREPTKGF